MTTLKETPFAKRAVVLGIDVRVFGSDNVGFYYSINGEVALGPFPSPLIAAEAAETSNELLKQPRRSVRRAAALAVRIFDAEPGETHTCDICGSGISRRIHVLVDGRTVGQDCVRSIGRKS